MTCPPKTGPVIKTMDQERGDFSGHGLPPKKQRVDELLERHPSLKGFYWAKEKVMELYRQQSRQEATRTPDNIALNLKLDDDEELIKWGNTLTLWREPSLNHFDNRTTNGFTERCNTKIKTLKRISYGLRNVDV